MATKVSEIYGKPIFSGNGEKIGSVSDVILDIESGKVERLSTDKLKGITKNQLKSLIKDNSVSYDKVKSIGDIVLLGGKTPKRKTSKSKKTKQETSESKSSAFGSFINQ